jgi:RNA polymerase sigma factor (sigma-70 family)
MTQQPVPRMVDFRPDSTADRDEVLQILFRRHYAALLRLAMVLLGSREEAEEVVQDAFFSLHRHWNGLRDTGSAGAYLRAAVVGGCRSRRRRFARAAAMAPRLAMVVADATLDERSVSVEDAAAVAAAVRALPTRQREVVVARYYLGLTEAQTAELLHVGVGSVKRHTHRALAALERRMEATS